MSNREVWVAFTKSRPLEGCGIDFDGSEFYFTSICVPVDETSDNLIDLGKIEELVKSSLLKKRLAIADISMLVRYKYGDWECKTDIFDDINKLAEKAMETGELAFSGFRPEEIEELQTYRHIIVDADYE